MIEITIPGRGLIELEHLVCDVNGTLALDGELLEGVAGSLKRLSNRLSIHLLTANTFKKQDLIDSQLGVRSLRLTPGNEAEQKAAYIRQLGAQHCAAIGQGANDAAMLREAAIGLCVLSREGSAVEALQAADVVVSDILIALELFERPLRLIATLRK